MPSALDWGVEAAVSEVRWRVAVDADRCVGSGVCVGTALGRFVLDGGRSRPVDELTEPDQAVLDAAETCPTEAIAVVDAAGHPLAPER